jgi:hypothetical protein
MYQQTKPLFEGQPAQCIKRLSDNAFIPFDPANTDYQEYLKWLDAGNTPLLAEGNAPIGADTPLPADEIGEDTSTTATTE